MPTEVCKLKENTKTYLNVSMCLFYQSSRRGSQLYLNKQNANKYSLSGLLSQNVNKGHVTSRDVMTVKKAKKKQQPSTL